MSTSLYVTGRAHCQNLSPTHTSIWLIGCFSWAPTIIEATRNTVGGEEVEGERLALAQGVPVFASHSCLFDTHLPLGCSDKEARQVGVDAAVLLQVARPGRLLRDSASLKQVCEHVVSILLPKLMAEVVVNHRRTARRILPLPGAS